MPGRGGLERGGEGLEVLAVLVGVLSAGEDIVERLEQLVVGERRRVGLRKQRQQPALVLGVVEQDDLFGVGAAGELAPLVAIGDRDDEGELARVDRRPVERHAALHESAQHREEPAARARDRRAVGTVRGDVAVSVEQVRARDPHVVEVQTAVVDAVQAALRTVVLAPDAGQELLRRPFA